MKPMLSQEITGNTQMLSGILELDFWGAQQKFDGIRAMIQPATGKVISRSGQELRSAAGRLVLPHILNVIEDRDSLALEALEPFLWLDGELMPEDGTFRIFDAAVEGDRRPYCYRMGQVQDAVKNVGEDSPLKVVETRRGERAKRYLLERAEKEGREGVIFRHLHGTYLPGKRSSASFKWKFTHEADLVVVDVSTGPLSAGLAVMDPIGGLRKIVRVSLIGKPEVKPGDVVTVRYLNWTGHSLIQPRLLTVRHDKEPGECTADQFREYSKDEI